MRVYRMSELEVWLTCRRRYRHQYVDRLESRKFQGVPREVGSAVHKGIEVLSHGGNLREALEAGIQLYDEGWRSTGKELTTEDWEKIADGREQVRACLGAYSPPSDSPGVEVIGVEKAVLMPMGRERGLEGRIDLVLRVNKRNWVYDTKTSGLSQALVIKAMRVRKQFVGYTLLAESLGLGEMQGVMLDLVDKPRVYRRKDGGVTVSEVKTHREPIAITATDREQFVPWFHRIVDEIEEARAGEGLWLQNSSACINFNRICQFWELCSQPGMANRLVEVLYTAREPGVAEGGVDVDE